MQAHKSFIVIIGGVAIFGVNQINLDEIMGRKR